MQIRPEMSKMLFSYNEDYLNADWVQSTLNRYLDDLPLFNQIMDKGMNKTSRKIRMYFAHGEFIGYLIYVPNFFKFDENRKLLPDENKASSFKTLNINDIEVRKSIRENKDNPRYGRDIINNFINLASSKYDAITLQANNTELIDYYKKTFKFLNLKTPDNRMVLWLKKPN